MKNFFLISTLIIFTFSIFSCDKITETLTFVCPKCEKKYDSAKKAAECCGIQTVKVEKFIFSSLISETQNYNVYHLQQKPSGGKAVIDYVVEETEDSKTLEKNSTLENVKKTYPGFTAKLMAQNENSIYVFYDRNTITYSFNTGSQGKFYDGTSCKEVSGLYGASYKKPKTPTSDDYNFVKWVDTTETPAPSIFGVEDKSWTAVWKKKTSENSTIPEGFVLVEGTSITGTENWTPSSEIFITGRTITIPTLIVCDHEVTRGEFYEIMGTDPSKAFAFDKDGNQLSEDGLLNNPVDYVNWYSAITYCNKLSIKENLTPCYFVSEVTDWKNLQYSSIPTSNNTTWNEVICDFDADGYRLPTEAEWEWLARGGENYTYAGSDSIFDVAWFNSDESIDFGVSGSREVKTKQGNGYDLYDMSGNIMEWCWDWSDLIDIIDTNTPAYGASSGIYRVRRGGSWDKDKDDCLVSRRNRASPSNCTDNAPGSYISNFGFRVVRSNFY